MKLRIAVAFLLGGAMLVGGALVPLGAERSDAGYRAPSIEAFDSVSRTSDSGSESIGALTARVETDRFDARLHAQLGLAYLQASRDEAEPSYLPLAEEALDRSLELESKRNLEAFVGTASLANARHDFSNSVKWSRRAIATNPYSATPYGLLGDALFELGDVPAADAAYQKMVDLRPDVASYVRASYALQFHGRMRPAIQAMELAVRAAGPNGETAAWVRHQMGDIYAGLRNNREAARQNRIGMALAPGYVPPTVGLAESYMATGRLDDAVPVMEEAVDGLPALEYMITLGDLYAATGREAFAEKQYRDVAGRLQSYRASGVLPDADFIVFYADHGLRPRAALREASAIYRDRPTGKTADAYAWMLHSLGRDRVAWRYAQEAIASPGRDASMLFHAAAIARARDDAGAKSLARRALELDPAFSVVQAQVARRIAGE